MANVIKLRKGLNINLKGKATEQKRSIPACEEYALSPECFEGMVPKVVVREGDKVKAGDTLFVNKLCPDVRFASPVSGTVSAIVRGERRKVLCVKVKADTNQVYADFGILSIDRAEFHRQLASFKQSLRFAVTGHRLNHINKS